MKILVVKNATGEVVQTVSVDKQDLEHPPILKGIIKNIVCNYSRYNYHYIVRHSENEGNLLIDMETNHIAETDGIRLIEDTPTITLIKAL